MPPRLQPTSSTGRRVVRSPRAACRAAPSCWPWRRVLTPEQPRMGAPAGPGQRAAQVHRRPVGGEEAGDDQRRRAVLGPARAERAEARQQARHVPRDLAHAAPARRREVVGVELALGAGPSGAVRSHFMVMKMGYFRYRNKNRCAIRTRFRGSCRFRAPPAGRRGATRRTPCGCSRSRPPVALIVEPARGAERDDPVAARPDGQRRHRRLVGDARDRRLVDLVPGDPFVEPPDIVLSAGRR